MGDGVELRLALRILLLLRDLNDATSGRGGEGDLIGDEVDMVNEIREENYKI